MKASPAPRMLNTSIGKPGPLMPCSMSSGMARSNTTQPIGPRLTTISASGASSRILRQAPRVSVVPPAMWILFLGADDHVAARQDGLQVGRDALVGDETLLAEAMAGQAPQHRPVVDVEDHAAAVLLARRIAFLLMASRLGLEKWVPETTTAPAEAM